MTIRSQFFLFFLCDKSLAIKIKDKTKIATTIQFRVWLSARIVFMAGRELVIIATKLQKILFLIGIFAFDKSEFTEYEPYRIGGGNTITTDADKFWAAPKE
ncbi:MAG: hypothetical protein IK103_02965 [Bacteroidales bacterium]|nr:hypothetical protein [Bacteroidales bacterium]